MALNTPRDYRNLVIYEAYVRNHGPQGTFADVEADLARIKSMGVDILWFMPIHPIGILNRKGTFGSPYSIADYSEVNPEYGTKDDFIRLVNRAHTLGLKIMIDVVFNHTSHDSVMIKDHPEWFHRDENGNPVTTVPEWSDVIDLIHPNSDLSSYLIAILKDWVRLGVDGFRCDVASLIPLEFWVRARGEVANINPNVIWLAESVHASFIETRRLNNLTALSDGELYTAFDLTYDYDIWPMWQAAVTGKIPVTRYLELLRFQETIYPENYVKMRCVENHDNPRIMALAPTPEQALAWTAFQAFNKGAFLIYAGQEAAAVHTPSLFEIDKIQWRNYPLQDFLTKLAQLKKDPAEISGKYVILSGEPAIQAMWYLPNNSLYGIFNTSKIRGDMPVYLPDGVYHDLLSGNIYNVSGSRLDVPETAAIFRVSEQIPFRPFYTELMDFHFEIDK